MDDIAHVIQLSIAPVFLLTAIGTLLNVLSSRLARIVDRGRTLNERAPEMSETLRKDAKEEFALLLRRRRLVHGAITTGTIAALLVCLMIASAFVGALIGWNLSYLVATLFILVMAAFVATLLQFLREVLLAAGGVHFERGLG
jgi:hypothetical protein